MSSFSYVISLIFITFQLQVNELPKPCFVSKTLRELRIGTFENIETATEDTSIILALKKFVERRVSALPIIDGDGKLVNIYSKFDVIVSRVYNSSWYDNWVKRYKEYILYNFYQPMGLLHNQCVYPIWKICKCQGIFIYLYYMPDNVRDFFLNAGNFSRACLIFLHSHDSDGMS